MEKQFLFSVVMPIYNVEEYLEEAILSVVNQTIGFDKIQLILVNDGSPDNCDAICLKYKEKYPDNIVYLKKKNGGVSSARNYGIDYIEGELVNFFDSDDKWDENAFEAAYDFYKAHKDEVDVIAARIKFFEAKNDYHVLDYKFKKGTRVADLSMEEEFQSVQSHVINVFVKKEAIGNLKFDPELQYNEDSVFINKIILKKLKCGLVREALYYYRKRLAQNSAVDGQALSLNYYTTALTNYHLELFRYSKELYGEIVPYAQAAVNYDIMWRFCKPQIDIVFTDEKEKELFFERVREILLQIDEKILLKNPKHISVERRSEAVLYRDGVDFVKSLVINEEDETFYYKDIPIMKLSRNKGTTCKIIGAEIKNGKVFLDILLAKWLLRATQTGGVPYLLCEDKMIELKGEECFIELIKTRYGEKPYYDRYRVEFPIDFIKKGSKAHIKIAIKYGDTVVPVSLAYGELVPNSNNFKYAYRFYGKYALKCYRTVISVLYPKEKSKSQKNWEKECVDWLNEKEQFEAAEIRSNISQYREELKDRGKILLIFDDKEKIGFSLFKHMCKKAIGVHPVLVKNEDGKYILKSNEKGSVVSLNDREYPYYLLCSNKVFYSSDNGLVINTLGDNLKYLVDLIDFKEYDYNSFISEDEKINSKKCAKLILDAVHNDDKSTKIKRSIFRFLNIKRYFPILLDRIRKI